MLISEIKNIERLNDFVYYRQNFAGVAVYNIAGMEKNAKIKFTIEESAVGEKNISVVLVDNIDWPVLQVMMEIKNIIKSLIKSNELPLLENWDQK
ncbi:MAG: hypothetical protein CR988_00585 [Treponema sp.]|nr:MAG: hypothetical protein CR988_00585 [Treponema sp.]